MTRRTKASTLFLSLCAITGSVCAAETAPPPNVGWRDSWEGIHSFLVFASVDSEDPVHLARIAPRYDFGWSSGIQHLRPNNPTVVDGVYFSSIQVDKGVKWVKANHPDWILYKED